MGLLDGTTQNTYYNATNPASYGSSTNYQFTTLENIINNFMIAYIGEAKIISKASITDVRFHAMRAIQELSYDVLRSFKSQEIEVPNTLSMILPQDYVNYVKLVRIGKDGIERILYPARKTSDPFAIAQVDGVYQFTGDDLTEQIPSDTSSSFKSQTPIDYHHYDINSATDVEISKEGRRYGLDPQHSQINGSFFIDQLRGLIKFGSDLAGETITLHYVSDGLGTDSEMVVHKFCEEACYKHIAYAIVSTRSNIPPFIVARFKKERFAETRKAKIRLSNIKLEEFTQVLKGMGKQIK
jgi:virulence-associated protein VagC